MSASENTARAFILASLHNLGVAQDKLQAINHGADIYGPQGLLDSIHLVGLISAIGEWVDTTAGNSESFFDILDDDLFDNFKDINRIESLLNGKFSHVSFCA
ncbi:MULTISPECIES: hypothetical protein [Pseudomonas]|uniref:hypothetical protein n=1 Tax=Pseudomonas TaxID=286 RepID=UPI0008126534|nr:MULTISPECIES: hypothetical protein [unclassified Pseudomonas]MBW8128766.1 hypothetical protein [Pseudomonas sp. LAP_36]MBW8137678.1 hypothetical protein [Pseudomonas sp. PAMC 26818]CRL98637.1 hypothetical protein [Pseudomonas sp. 24 R 17]CRM26972.1 hypothetical protein [Pseudomonas sp. 24 E 1]CRM31398.1 hypothetical protein [Pseudomonas sp. 52 E 6]